MGSYKSGKRGWRAYVDLSGQQFGRWTVIKRCEDNQWGQVMYLCKCECGWVARTQSRILKDGTSQSCGCLKSELASERMKGQRNNGFFNNKNKEA